MKTLSYSPSVEAYVMSGEGRRQYDLSGDIVQCTVTRKCDAASEFSLTLQNKDWKYNGVFTPMDPIVIYAAKESRVKLFTGYITSVDAFQLYQADFKMSGLCTLHRIQQLYWDPLLYESQMLMFIDSYMNGDQDNGYMQMAKSLLMNVGGWSSDQIIMQPSVPTEAIDFARSMYEANRSSSEQLKNMADEFYKVLREHGPKISTGSSTDGSVSDNYDFSGNDNAQIVWNFCKSQGFSNAAAAAVIGNGMAESGLNPDRHQDGGPAYGMFQWEDLTELTNVANELGTQISDIKAQLICLLRTAPYAFNTYSGHGTFTYDNGTVTWWPDAVTFDEWKKWTDVAKATECFCRVWERPSIPHMENRIGYAQSALDQFGGGAG